MKELKIKRILTYLTMVAAFVVLAGCSKATRTEVSVTPTPLPGGAASASVGVERPSLATTHSAPPPAPAEAQAALERVYKQAALLDKAHPDSFIVGDFNGDGSEDIAIAAKPAEGKLGEINSEFANWIVEDPKSLALSDMKRPLKSVPSEPGPTKVEQRDALLAIIHGYGQDGWRSTEATQSYLLKNSVGEQMRACIRSEVSPGALKVKKEGVNSRADIISEKLSGTAGFIYWTRGKYAWHEE